MELAGGIAQRVKEKAGGPRIAIHCTHSPGTYASILAVTLLGGSYVPLNPKYPDIRLQEILDLCDPSVLITEKKLDLRTGEQLIIQGEWKSPEQTEPIFDEAEAYVLFTSGTTGKPKGVPITHANLQGFFDHFAGFGFNENDRFIQAFDLSFDVSVMMMFLCWEAGACLFPVQPEGHKPFNVLNCIRDNEITVCAMVPSLLSYVEKYLPGMKMKRVRYTFFAGERLSVHNAAQWKQACPASRIYNAYGPSEATIVCMAHEFSPENSVVYGADVPIGKTFAGTSAILVDEELNEISEGKGEICLIGVQVIGHYLNNQDEDRFFLRSGKRYYRTGDLGFRNKEGDLVFSGRLDAQVKINGYRIEPAEITRAVHVLCGRRSEVIPISINGDQVLIGFIEGEVSPPELKEKLLDHLPSYMVPREFIPLKNFPIGTHDKVDKKRLVQLYYERDHT